MQRGALEGITRELVLQLAKENSIETREQPLGVYDLYAADECFLTGTGAELIAVASIVAAHCLAAQDRCSADCNRPSGEP